MFSTYVDPVTGEENPNIVVFTDENGYVWHVPKDHRIWKEVYEPWLESQEQAWIVAPIETATEQPEQAKKRTRKKKTETNE